MRDLEDVVAAWAGTTGALVELGRFCSAPDFARPTECPGWSVQDQLSHVVGIERWMLGEPVPQHDLPDLPHLRNDFARTVEVAVDLRRSRPGPAVVEELDAVRDLRLHALADPALDPAAPTPSPVGGTLPLRDVVWLRTFDVFTHEQDVRRALERPGGLDSPAAALAVQWLRRALPRVVARDARVEPGRVVVVEVAGHGGFTDAVAVTARDGGKAAGTVLPDVPSDADAVLRLTAEAYLRRSCGRWAARDTPAQVSGDAAVAGRVLEALAVTP